MTSSSQIELVAIDDERSVLDFVKNVLARPGLNISLFTSPLDAWDCIRRVRPDIVILDQNMPESSGMEMLVRITDWDPAIDVVILSGEDSTELAVRAIQHGACDYLTKPIEHVALRERVELLIAAAQKRRLAGRLEGEMLDASRFGDMIGRSAPMLDVFALVSRISRHFRSVLITGQTGTGKELVARALHRLSPVSMKPFVVCNCAAITETLFESELFGHVRGSFTGASRDRAGHFEAADGGTLFLDEIGEVPLAMQSKFLRALQNGEIQRVGSSLMRRVSVRVIAATNRNLRAMVKAQEFREDLYYRLATLEVKVPPLEERKDDIPLLCRHFVEQFSRQMEKEVRGLTRRAQTALVRRSFPGNIRELENVVGHACLMADGDLIDVADLPEYIRDRNGEPEDGMFLTLEEVENRHIRRVLDGSGGNKQRAAEILGISRAKLYRFLSVSDIDPASAETHL
jgi:DNA-binding NtrC family response regulator